MTALLCVVLLNVAVWLIVLVFHYFGWKDYDREFGTEYRFNEGTEHVYSCGVCKYIFNKPRWMIWILKKLEGGK